MDACAWPHSGLIVRLIAAITTVVVVLVVGGCGDPSATVDPPDRASAVVSPTATAASDAADRAGPPSETVVYLPPPYVARTEWVQTAVGPSWQVYPTDAGRRVTSPGAQKTAWREVVAESSDYGQYSATSPGMRAQFDCHWVWARAVQPDKTSWNLEPGRPVVTEDQMVATQCNPGMPEE